MVKVKPNTPFPMKLLCLNNEFEQKLRADIHYGSTKPEPTGERSALLKQIQAKARMGKRRGQEAEKTRRSRGS